MGLRSATACCKTVAQHTVRRQKTTGEVAPVSARHSRWVARRRQLLPGHLAGASFTDHRCSLPNTTTHRAAPSNSDRQLYPLPPVSGLQLSATRCPVRPPLRPATAIPVTRAAPRRSTTRPPRDCRNLPSSIARSASSQPHTTPTRCPESSTERLASTCLFAGHLYTGLLPTSFRRGTITPGAATAIDAVCIAHSQWRTQTQNQFSRRSRSHVEMRKP
jgi:hypothetical protein